MPDWVCRKSDNASTGIVVKPLRTTKIVAKPSWPATTAFLVNWRVCDRLFRSKDPLWHHLASDNRRLQSQMQVTNKTYMSQIQSYSEMKRNTRKQWPRQIDMNCHEAIAHRIKHHDLSSTKPNSWNGRVKWPQCRETSTDMPPMSSNSSNESQITSESMTEGLSWRLSQSVLTTKPENCSHPNKREMQKLQIREIDNNFDEREWDFGQAVSESLLPPTEENTLTKLVLLRTIKAVRLIAIPSAAIL